MPTGDGETDVASVTFVSVVDRHLTARITALIGPLDGIPSGGHPPIGDQLVHDAR